MRKAGTSNLAELCFNFDFTTYEIRDLEHAIVSPGTDLAF